jgi:hypothetical protein
MATAHPSSTSAVASTPPLPVVKADYLRGGMSQVRGWLHRSTAVYLSAVEVLQSKVGIDGDVCEIGVHHGKSFLCLALGLPNRQQAVAIDLFDNRALNVDHSGWGDRAIFERNLAAHRAGRNVAVIAADSTRLDDVGFLSLGPRFRLFSIDGGHTPAVSCNDLFVAERTITDRGIVVLDDFLNPRWLGVITGLFRYWSSSGALIPLAAVPGKLLLTTSLEQAKFYQDLLSTHFGKARIKRQVPLGNHEIDVYGDYAWAVLDDSGRIGPVAPNPHPRDPAGAARWLPGFARPVARRALGIARALGFRAVRSRENPVR